MTQRIRANLNSMYVKYSRSIVPIRSQREIFFSQIILESKDKSQKFEYRRMVIDESGDGEFVEKSKSEQLKARKRRDVSEPWDESFDGPKKMASRAAPVENYSKRNVIPVRQGDTEDDTSRLGDSSGEAEKPDDSSETIEPQGSVDKLVSPESGDDNNADGARKPEDSNNSGQSDFEDDSGEAEESAQSAESAESGYADEGEESGDEADRGESQETSKLKYCVI